mgnify:CR=1 FL=1
MYSKQIFFLCLVVTTLSFAQTKLGTVNSGLIINKMPQMKNVATRISNYAKKLDSSYQQKAKDFQLKIDAFKSQSSTMSDDAKKKASQDLTALDNDLIQFRQNGAKMIQLQREQFTRPLYQKLSEVIAEVAKEQGYTQILTSDGNQFGYIDERYDITTLVLKKLGLE